MRRQCEIDVIKAKRKINYYLKESFLIENALCVVSSKTEKARQYGGVIAKITSDRFQCCSVVYQEKNLPEILMIVNF